MAFLFVLVVVAVNMIVIMRMCLGICGRMVMRVVALHGAMLTGELIWREVVYALRLIRADQHFHVLAHTARQSAERVTAFKR